MIWLYPTDFSVVPQLAAVFDNPAFKKISDAPMTHLAPSTPAEHARAVIARTTTTWRIAPVSPRAAARRAPHGHVPVRLLRRIGATAWAPGLPVFAHSW